MGWDKYTDWEAGKDKKTVPIPKEEADKIRETLRRNQKKSKSKYEKTKDLISNLGSQETFLDN